MKKYTVTFSCGAFDFQYEACGAYDATECIAKLNRVLDTGLNMDKVLQQVANLSSNNTYGFYHAPLSKAEELYIRVKYLEAE